MNGPVNQVVIDPGTAVVRGMATKTTARTLREGVVRLKDKVSVIVGAGSWYSQYRV